jgi:hypothetical protein
MSALCINPFYPPLTRVKLLKQGVGREWFNGYLVPGVLCFCHPAAISARVALAVSNLCDLVCKPLDVPLFLNPIVESWQEMLLVHGIQFLD